MVVGHHGNSGALVQKVVDGAIKNEYEFAMILHLKAVNRARLMEQAILRL